MRTTLTAALAVLICITVSAQEKIDLKGDWGFSIDRNDKGVAEKWYSQELDDDKISLPGSMPEKLKGDIVTAETQWTGSLYDSSYYYNPYMEKYRKEGNIKFPFFLTPDRHYVGVAWYDRTVTIPDDWKGKRVVFFMERPHIETTVWINGQNVGSQNSLCVAHEYDITNYARPGKCHITVRIDNRLDVAPVGQDSHSVTDQTQGNWNGVVGQIYLKSTPKTYIDDIQVYPDIENKTAKVVVNVKGSGKAELTLSAKSFNSDINHEVPALTQTVKASTEGTVTEITLPMGHDVQLWDEFNPALYKLTTELSSAYGKETKEVQFGMRKFEIKGKWFYVNGRKIMLRGTVENCDFPLTGYAPMDVESWERVFRICRNYGLNHIRFHSFCPPEAAFIAADLVGFYLQPEGPSWPNHGVKLGVGQPIDKYLFDETIALTKKYGNYASYCMLACGNEPAGHWVEWVSDFVDYWKATDPRHVYTGASVGGGWAWQPKNMYHVKAGVRGLTWSKERPRTDDDYTDVSKIDTVSQPYVSHETGQWCAFPNFSEIRKYTGVNKAKNFEIFRDILDDNGMSNQAYWFTQASGKLQALCYKYEIEKTMRTPDYAGFQLLALNDYSGQGSALVGVLDVFFEEKGYIDAKTWRRFCSSTVPLMRTGKFIYTNNDTLKADIEIAHFGNANLNNATVSYSIRDKYGKLYSKGTWENKCIPIGNRNEIGNISFALNDINEPTELNLEVRIEGTEAINDWNFWIYPNKLQTMETDIYITDSLDTKALETLQSGGNVLITAAGKISYGREVKQQFMPVFWNTSWFKMRPPHTTGILTNPNHPLFKTFPTDFHSNIQWWELLNGAQVMQFTDFPINFQPTVQSIDTWFVSRKIGTLFEANVLNGKLLMTSMDITSDLENRIVARQLRNAIISYMDSDQFRPEYNVEVERIADLFTKVAGDVQSFTKDSPDELKPKKVF